MILSGDKVSSAGGAKEESVEALASLASGEIFQIGHAKSILNRLSKLYEIIRNYILIYFVHFCT